MAQALVSVHLVPAFVIVFTELWPRESGGGQADTASRASVGHGMVPSVPLSTGT